MKYFKKINWQILLLLIFMSINSCQNNNDPELLFDDVPSVRLNKKLKEVKDFLIASKDGWKTTYFTDNTALGGYTFLFNFINESEVKMDSDFGNPDPQKTSLYSLSLGSTLKLTFTTKNVIHELSDGNSYPDNEFVGKGYKGDFEFLFSSFDGEDIIFRSNRDPSNYIRFKKATAEDWNSRLSKNKEIKNIVQNDLPKPVFRSLETLSQGKSTVYTFDYNLDRRYATIKNIVKGGLELEGGGIGVGFTSTGIVISPALKVGSTEISEFTFETSTSSFVAEKEGVKATIKYVDKPLVLLQPYNFGVENNTIRVMRSNPSTYSIDKSSYAFKNFFDNWKKFFSENEGGKTISRVYIRNLNASSELQIYYLSSGREYILHFPLSYTISETSIGNKIVKFKEIGMATVSRTGSQPLLDFIFRNSGFYIQKMEFLNSTQNTIGLIAVDDVTMLMHWYDF